MALRLSALRAGRALLPGRFLRHYDTNRKVAGSRPDEVNAFFFFFQFCIILPAALVRGVYSASNRNEYQEVKDSPRVSLTAIYDPTV
jgi:hypothetical protein